MIEIINEQSKNIKKDFLKLKKNEFLKINMQHEQFYIVLDKTKFKFLNQVLINDNAVDIYIELKEIYFNKISIPLELLEYYMSLLQNINCSEDDWRYILQSIYILMKNQLKIGDSIKFNNGRRGEILAPITNHYGQIYYRLIKKDSTLGKKRMVLCANKGDYQYICENREFVDFIK